MLLNISLPLSFWNVELDSECRQNHAERRPPSAKLIAFHLSARCICFERQTKTIMLDAGEPRRRYSLRFCESASFAALLDQSEKQQQMSENVFI